MSFMTVSELGVRHLIPSEANFHVSYKEVILIHIHNLLGQGEEKEPIHIEICTLKKEWAGISSYHNVHMNYKII